MASETTALKTGMTILRGGDVPSYTLEYLTPGRRKKAGEFETIVIPNVLIGRGEVCNIQFGDAYPTVSRKHAAIERRGSEFYLIHLSKTNPTLLNGQAFPKEILLKNGDEIQFSMEGPKLRFNVTPSGTASMGFTKKISLVAQQAIKPYKTLVYLLISLIIVIAGTGAWFIYRGQKEVKVTEEQLTKYKLVREQDSIRLAMQEKQFIKLTESTTKEINAAKAREGKSAKVIGDLKKQMEEFKPSSVVNSSELGPDFYEKFKESVYYLEVVEILVRFPDGSTSIANKKWTGTGFLCSDGKFITARHCIQGWRYSANDSVMALINFAELNGGKLFVKFRATSINNWFEFNYSDVVLDDSSDKTITEQIDIGDGKKKRAQDFTFKFVSNWGQDWAYVQKDKTSNIEYDKDLSTKLRAGEKTYVLGFSLGQGGPYEGTVNPIYSESNVGQTGVLSSGLVTVTSRSFEQGNSGGPVFVQKDKKFICVGIVSRGTFDATGSFATIAYFVPIANIK